jgi:hypothetical protein
MQQGDAAMRSKPKRILITASVAFCIAVIATVLLYRPNRTIVIDVKGTSNRNFDAFFVVDGREQRQTVTLPKTFTFYARDVRYRVTPLDTDFENELTGRIYTDDGFADGSSTGWSVGAHVSCSNILHIWRGGIGIMTYTKDNPGPEVTTGWR